MTRKFLLLLIFVFLAPVVTHGQSCTTATCTAAGVTQANVLAALPSPSNTNATVVVNIPSGTSAWTANINYTVPSAVTSLTIQGATSCTGSGDPSQNNLACTDNTIIQDNDATDGNGLFIIASVSGFVRISGITWEKGTGAQKTLGLVAVNAGNQARIDHNHFNSDTGSGNATALLDITGCTNGVADHNIWTNTTGASGFGVTLNNANTCGGLANGDYTWNQPTGFGTSNAFFVEQNSFVNGTTAGSSQANDCQFTGRQVLRFNSLTNGAHFQTHPTDSAGNTRGCRMTEIYGNKFTFTLGSGNLSFTLFFYSSGPALYWGNKAVQNGTAGYQSLVELTDCRSPASTTRCGYSTAVPPTSWGACVSGNSGWDGNSTGVTPYPCIDQPTRGQGDLLGGTFPNRCNKTTNPACNIFTGQWPHEFLEPLYAWLNAYVNLCCGNGNGYLVPNGSIWTANQDYYNSSDPSSGTDCNGFTGATGVGCGARASRPATCTAGPGGTYGQSPTGSYGVAWWATDQGAWNLSGNGFGNGVLDICTATNTWSNAVVTPYQYPHPLEGNSPVFSFSPTFLSFGSVLVGSTSPAQNITVSNTGSATFTISSIALAGANPADFTESNNCGTSVSPGGSCTLVVKCQPVSATSFAANVTVTDSAPGSPHTAPLTCTGTTATAGISFSPTTLSFAAQTVGTSSSPQTVTVTNTGSANLVITNVAVTGGNNTSFSQTNSCGTVAASGTCPINVTFTPQAAGALASTVCVTDNAPASPQCFNISGTGNTTGNLNFAPASLAFPNQAIHTTSATMTFTATNSGGSAITISSIAITGTNAADFAQTNNCGTGLAAGGSCTVSVKFTPSANGSRTAAVTLTDTAPGSPQSVSLQGTGFTPAPAVTLSTTTVAFGNQTVGTQSNAQVVILTNSGTATLTVSTATMSGANPGDFGFSTTCGASLAVNASCSYSLTFSPTTSGSRSATFNVNTNAASSPNTVSLTGTGMTSPNGAPAPQVFGD